MDDSRISFRRTFCLIAGLALPLAALLLHFLVIACFARKWDKVAVVTVIPFWVWGLAGLIFALAGWIIGRQRFGAFVTLVWLVTLLVGSDETKGLRSNPDLPDSP